MEVMYRQRQSGDLIMEWQAGLGFDIVDSDGHIAIKTNEQGIEIFFATW